MRITPVNATESSPSYAVSFSKDVWYRAPDILPESHAGDLTDILAYVRANPAKMETAASGKEVLTADALSSEDATLPFQPRSYRDFMLYEKHCINASRGFVRKYLPHLLPVVSVYETIFKKPFPKLKPRKRWYRHPIYYLGNHLNFIPHKAQVHIPSYTHELDYELELGAVICRPLKNASSAEAEAAIGGFVVFNDFSARDVQMDEMESGFGPMKAKNFANAISSVVITADEILPRIDSLTGRVFINDQKIVETTTAGMHYTLAEAIAYASWEEQLYPGEFFGSGTLPGGCGMENGHLLKKGDTIRLEIDGVGILQNQAV